jgi:hypothetical protein
MRQAIEGTLALRMTYDDYLGPVSLARSLTGPVIRTSLVRTRDRQLMTDYRR